MDRVVASTRAGARAESVREMFGSIAPRYDLLNSVLSFGVDRRWRRQAAATALELGARELLDVATGTGELALELLRRAPGSRVVGLDFSPEMLERARLKASRAGAPLELVEGDALALPFPAESFDAVTIAYGLRNLGDRAAGLREFHRVLRPGGRLVILEFPQPPEGLFGALFRLYFVRILPILGGLVSGRRSAYTYLPASVLAFPLPSELAAEMTAAGFTGARHRLQSFGISALFVGEKR